MKYNIRRWNPILISIPDIGIGMMWGSLGNVVAFFGYTFTNSAADIAKIYSLAAIVGVFTQVIVGVLSDKTQHKWGKRSPWLVFGMVGAALSVTLWPLANSFTMFLIMTGVTCTLVNVAQCAYYTMVMEVVDADQVGYSNTLARTTSTVGGLCMGGLAGFLWNAQHPEMTFFAMAALMALSTVLIVPAILKERPENYTKSEPYRLSFDFLTNKEVMKLFIITFLFFAARTGTGQMATSLFVKNYHFSEHVVGRFAVFESSASLLFGFTAFKLIDVFNRKHIFAFSAIGLCLANVYLVFFLHEGASPWILYAWTLACGLFFIGGNICMYTVLSMVVPKSKLGEYMGLLNLFIALPQFIFSNVYGHIIDAGHATWVLPTVISCYFIAFLFTLTMKLKGPKELALEIKHD
ncbi:MAG: MFS transporter [Neisseriales bacterium]|nr:MAG: MFS transporter [Neisseriales bacterium]